MLKIYIILLFTLFSFTSCSSTHEDDSNVKHSKTIEIAFASWPGFDIIYYAQIKGIFDKYNLNVKLTKYPNQEEATKALQNNEVDAVMTSIFDALYLQSEREFNIILSTNVSAGADGIVAQKNITSFKDLKGKNISAQKGTVNELILFEALEFNNMSFNDVNIIDITNEEALPKLFHKNLDAAVIWEPLLSKTKNKIDGKILFTTKDLNSSVLDILIIQQHSLKKNAQEWEKFLFSWFDLMKELEADKDKVMKVIEKKTINPNFAQDYAGLKAGTAQLNQQIFSDNRLEKAIDKVNSFIDVKKQAKIVIKKDFFNKSYLEWKKIHSN